MDWRERPRYNRDKLRYPSDLTDEEWAHVEPLIPPATRGGGKRRVNIREVVNGLMHILSTGLSGSLCLRRYPSLNDEPSAEDDSELGFCLAPFSRRSLPLLGRMVQDQI